MDWERSHAKEGGTEITFKPALVGLQDFTGVPTFVEFTAMRDADSEGIQTSLILFVHQTMLYTTGYKLILFVRTETIMIWFVMRIYYVWSGDVYAAPEVGYKLVDKLSQFTIQLVLF